MKNGLKGYRELLIFPSPARNAHQWYVPGADELKCPLALSWEQANTVPLLEPRGRAPTDIITDAVWSRDNYPISYADAVYAARAGHWGHYTIDVIPPQGTESDALRVIVASDSSGVFRTILGALRLKKGEEPVLHSNPWPRVLRITSPAARASEIFPKEGQSAYVRDVGALEEVLRYNDAMISSVRGDFSFVIRRAQPAFRVMLRMASAEAAPCGWKPVLPEAMRWLCCHLACLSAAVQMPSAYRWLFMVARALGVLEEEDSSRDNTRNWPVTIAGLDAALRPVRTWETAVEVSAKRYYIRELSIYWIIQKIHTYDPAYRRVLLYELVRTQRYRVGSELWWGCFTEKYPLPESFHSGAEERSKGLEELNKNIETWAIKRRWLVG